MNELNDNSKEFLTEAVNQSKLKNLLKRVPFLGTLIENLNQQYERDRFIVSQLSSLEEGTSILDAGCGSQRYRKLCRNLDYKSQDFGEYVDDDKPSLGTDGVGGGVGYSYGKIDYKGNIWNIDESDRSFDTILCTEVFEHIPYPIETITEFSRLLKPGGKLILTAPNACLRHMNPYFFYTGFSDNWYKKILEENDFEINLIDPIGDYYRYHAVEIARTMYTHSIFAKIILLPAFLYFYFKKKNQLSIDTLCGGYHVIATKK